ncbi:hypothetical protein ACFV2D_37225 [Streptomyces capillispiralis]|uniref:hypothetical protein n=1 Tax=Streptomyces capillispiralis TaxID=68182 RepID=UPI0036962998
MTSDPEPVADPSSSPSRSGAGQRIDITGGDHSPGNVSAPFSNAEQGGTASISVNPTAQPAPAPPWWHRSAVVWTAVGSVAAVVAAVVALLEMS